MNTKCFFVVYTGAESPEANIAEIRTRASSKFDTNSQLSSEIANQLEINIRPLECSNDSPVSILLSQQANP
jgi:hypothetical protein